MRTSGPPSPRSLHMPILVYALLPLVYVLARLTCRRLVSGTWTLDEEILTHMVVVPIVQLAALAVLHRFAGTKLW